MNNAFLFKLLDYSVPGVGSRSVPCCCCFAAAEAQMFAALYEGLDASGLFIHEWALSRSYTGAGPVCVCVCGCECVFVICECMFMYVCVSAYV